MTSRFFVLFILFYVVCGGDLRAESASFKKDTPKSSSLWASHTAIKHMNLSELGPAKDQYLKEGKKNFACSCLERMITLENDHYEQEALRLQLGTLYMDIQEFVKAEGAFKDFIALYPNSKDIEDVYVQAARCALQETLTCDRDQEKTRDCLEFAQNYLKHEPYKKHKNTMQDIARQCYRKLLDHEMYVCKFYIKKGKCKGAQGRLEVAKKEYVPHVPDGEKEVLVLECELAQNNDNHELYAQKTAELNKKFPATNSSNRINTEKKPYTKRF